MRDRRSPSFLALFAASLIATSSAAQQTPARPAAPASAFDGNVDALAAKNPDAMVTASVEFKPATTSQQIADLVTADKIPAISVVIRRPRGGAYDSIGYSFSALEPRMDEQLARARCLELYPAVVPIQSAPAFNATVVMTAAQAQRWMKTPPAIVRQTTVNTVMNDAQVSRAKELTHKLLTMRLPIANERPISGECSRFISAK
jgi:hypothetical protein